MDGGTFLLVGALLAGLLLLFLIIVMEDISQVARSLIIAFTVVFIIIVVLVLLYQVGVPSLSYDGDDGGSSYTPSATDYLVAGMGAMNSILPTVFSAMSKASITSPKASITSSSASVPELLAL